MSSMYGGQGMGNKIPKGYSQGRLQNFTPEMMQQFQSLFSHLGPESYLSRLAGGDEGLFEEIERPAKRQFSGVLGNIASKYSGTGLGARHSSGFQNEATSAAGEFAQGLQANRQGLQRQALGDLFNMSNMLLNQRPYENFLSEKKPGFLQSLFGGLGGGLASGAGQAGGMAALMKLLPLLGLA
jgi:hypothetical protein